jgi:hypothetical protein
LPLSLERNKIAHDLMFKEIIKLYNHLIERESYTILTAEDHYKKELEFA